MTEKNEFGLSNNAVKIFKDLYSFQGETIKDTFLRVANEFGNTDEEKQDIFNLLSSNIWRPNTPVFLNAGTSHKIYSACFVVGLEDSMNSIYDIANVARKIFQYGSGIGIPIGNLREKDSYIFEGQPDKPAEGKSCLTGDTILLNDKTNFAVENQKVTLEWLYNFYKNVKNPKYRVRSMLDDFGIGMNTIKDVIYNGKRPVYEIKTKSGYKIKATSNHRFLSESGEWKKVEDFSVKDKIGVNGKTRPISECKRCGKVRLLRGNRSKYKGLCENCVVSVFNGCSLKGSNEEFEKRSKARKNYRNRKEIKEYYSNINSGENNPMWRGDYANEVTARSRNKNIYLWNRENHVCERCGETKKRIEVHHKDGNPYNNEISNLEVLCIQCHNDEHKKRRAKGNYRLTREVYFDEIISIEYKGIEKVYDVKMEAPYHNFIANGFVSHNSGPITFMKLYDAVGETTKSGGRVRRAAILCSIPVWHPDILEFIRCKEKDGRLSNMNISVSITDEFMKCLEDGTPFKLRTPYDGSVVKEIDPKLIWDEIVKFAHKSADPGVLFIDTINRYNVLKNKMLIECPNPSLRKGTKLLTSNGIFEIQELENKEFFVPTLDNVLAPAKCFLSGRNKRLYKINLISGHSYYATAEHKWPVLINNNYKKKTTLELKPGDLFPKQIQNNLYYGEIGTYKDGFIIGCNIGNGWISDIEDNKRQYGFIISKDDIENDIKDIIVEKLKLITGEEYNLTEKDDNIEIYSSCLRLHEYFNSFEVDKKETGLSNFIWKKSSEDFRKGVIDGIFSSNGRVHKNKISLKLSHKKLIFDISELLGFYGIKTYINESSENNDIEYNNYTLEILKYDALNFRRIFKLSNKRKQALLENIPECKRTLNKLTHIQIVSVEETDLYEDVWDVSVYDNSHTFRLPYSFTGNCGEQVMPPFFACNLSAINISKFVGGEDDFNYDGLFETTCRIMKYMDNVIDKMDFPDKRFESNVKKYRPVGIGPMGLADAMFKLGYRYDKIEGKNFASNVMRTLTAACVYQSTILAEKHGSFFEYDQHKDNVENIIDKHIGSDKDSHMQKIMERVKEFGLRNSQFTTAQPTGCLVDNTLISSNKGIKKIIDYKDILQDGSNEISTESDFGKCHLKSYFDQGISNTVKITTENGYSLEGTYDHKVRVLSEGNGYIWKKINDLSLNDNVILKKNFIIDKEYWLDVKKAEFIGLYMANGWWNNDKLYISFNENDEDYIRNLINDSFGKTFNFNVFVRKDDYKCKFDISSKKMFDWFKKYNCIKEGDVNAFIPQIILDGSIDVINSFIKGYWKGDGCIINRDNLVSFKTISEIMANQLHTILLGLGYISRLSKNNVEIGSVVESDDRKIIKNHESYSITLDKTSSYNLLKQFKCNVSSNDDNIYCREYVPITPNEEKYFPERIEISNSKNCCVTLRKYKEVMNSDPYNWFVKNDLYMDLIKNKEYFESKHVNDLEVIENTHTYVANGFVTHNTVALSCDCSYGIEPSFGLTFTKNYIDGSKALITNPVFEEKFQNEEWFNDALLEKISNNMGSLKGLHNIPKEVKEVFITAHEIKYKDRIDIQAALQEHCSTAISSTVNLPKETTTEEISEIYKYAYQKGLKGITIYRDGSKKNQPVTFTEDKKDNIMYGFKRPSILSSKTYSVETGNGKMYVTVSDYKDKPLEVFIHLGKSGQVQNTFTEALGRIISIALQRGVPVEDITKTLIGINSDKMCWFRFEPTDKRPVQILSIPDAIAQLLNRYYIGKKFEGELSDEVCPQCGQKMLAIEGCFNCTCGYSKCS